MTVSDFVSWWPVPLVLVPFILMIRELITGGRRTNALTERLRQESSDWPTWKREANASELLEALVSDDPELRTLAEDAGVDLPATAKWFFLMFIAAYLVEPIGLVAPSWLLLAAVLFLLFWWFAFFRLTPRHQATLLGALRHWYRHDPEEWHQAVSRLKLSADPFGDALKRAQDSRQPEVRAYVEKVHRQSTEAWLGMGPLLLLMIGSLVAEFVLG